MIMVVVVVMEQMLMRMMVMQMVAAAMMMGCGALDEVPLTSSLSITEDSRPYSYGKCT